MPADNLFRSQALVQPYEMSKIESEREGIAGAVEGFRQARADEIYRQHRMRQDVERAQLEQSAAQAEIQMNEVRKMEAQQRLQMANEMAMLGMNKEQVRAAKLQNDALDLEIGERRKQMEGLERELTTHEQLSRINDYYIRRGKVLRVAGGKPVLEDASPEEMQAYEKRYGREGGLDDDIIRAASSHLETLTKEANNPLLPEASRKEAKAMASRLGSAIASGKRERIEQAMGGAEPAPVAPPQGGQAQSQPALEDPRSSSDRLYKLTLPTFNRVLSGQRDRLNKWIGSNPNSSLDDVATQTQQWVGQMIESGKITNERNLQLAIEAMIEFLLAETPERR